MAHTRSSLVLGSTQAIYDKVQPVPAGVRVRWSVGLWDWDRQEQSQLYKRPHHPAAGYRFKLFTMKKESDNLPHNLAAGVYMTIF